MNTASKSSSSLITNYTIFGKNYNFFSFFIASRLYLHSQSLYGIERLSEIFENPATEAKIQLFFLSAQKDPFGESFSKIIFKSSSEFLFWKKIRKFEIGQNVPNMHNFYWAFSAFTQRSYKTTKNYLGFIFS